MDEWAIVYRTTSKEHYIQSCGDSAYGETYILVWKTLAISDSNILFEVLDTSTELLSDKSWGINQFTMKFRNFKKKTKKIIIQIILLW